MVQEDINGPHIILSLAYGIEVEHIPLYCKIQSNRKGEEVTIKVSDLLKNVALLN